MDLFDSKVLLRQGHLHLKVMIDDSCTTGKVQEVLTLDFHIVVRL